MPIAHFWGIEEVVGYKEVVGVKYLIRKKTQQKVPKNTLTYPKICVNGKLGVTFRFQDFSVSKKYRIQFRKNLVSGFGFIQILGIVTHWWEVGVQTRHVHSDQHRLCQWH